MAVRLAVNLLIEPASGRISHSSQCRTGGQMDPNLKKIMKE